MTLHVTVQLAAARRGVPHARSLRRWAQAAFTQYASSRAGTACTLTIRVVGSAESRRLNRTWRGKDRATNVLSFPAGSAPAPLPLPELGDIAICAPVVAREARQQRKTPRAHWAHMVVHGVLHLLGYDHVKDRDAAAMEACEAKILKQFGYLNPYA
ncbi:hypothetical protein ACG33_05450 [Steroidobacter denitrificans]|uniref:Endoribonuclease YbeY n=1 Tax=Steroidobacter denitrificans TaxID=465721 RepID=A0A127FA92_STEDE|nr:rRNA maturation RNase YbeY [Steroidobacter denitrificans]AMN46551.1 hypothetical protein ACG33_05450 [Steroidobacter denitrificans]